MWLDYRVEGGKEFDLFYFYNGIVFFLDRKLEGWVIFVLFFFFSWFCSNYVFIVC